MTTRPEQETVITWTSADEKATVYSLHPRIWRACEKAGGVEINLLEGIRDGEKVARTYLVDPRCIVIRKRRSLSAEQLEVARERGRKLGSRESA